jgi:hypothetical protein
MNDAQQAAYNEVVAARSTADPSYVTEWNRFKKFVDLPSNDCTAQPYYLTRYNVDKYFTENIATRQCTPGTAERAMPALQWHAKHVEFPNDHPRFQVKSPRVDEAMEDHKAHYISKQLVSYVDAHSSLPTEKVSNADTTKLLTTALGMQTWADLYVSYNVDMQTMCRGDTIRKIRLCDMFADANHGPGNPNDVNIHLILGFVLKRITGAKDKAKHVRAIGMWPHKDWLRCGTNAVAAAILSQFHYDTNTSFCFDNTDGRPPAWYSLYLIKWQTYKPMGKAYNSMYKAANVKKAGGKVTHLRKAAIDSAGQGGAGREDIGRMSKHAMDKIDTRYLSELPPEVMHVAAGFSTRHGEHLYYVPRTLISFETLCDGKPDLSNNDIANMLFPRREIWIEQFRNSRNYDKATENFLLTILPHLAKVITQNGIYWLAHFPEHHVSRLLLKIFGESYVNWATEKRQWVQDHEGGVQDRQIENLNSGAQAALASVQNRLVEQGNTLQRIETKLDTSVKTTNEMIMQRLLALENRQWQQQPTSTNNNEEGSENCNISMTNSRAIGFQVEHRPIIYGATRIRMLELAPSLGQPAIPMEMPPTIQDLVFEHLDLALEDYAKNANKKQWPNALRMRLSRREFIFQAVLKKAKELRGIDHAANLQEASRLLDEDRQSMSITKYYGYLKSRDFESGKGHKRPRRARQVVN